MLGCEHVTACVAEILFTIISDEQGGTKVQTDFVLSDNFAS